MLTKLPGSKWWIETDENSEIIGTYNKAQIIADIQAITNTLKGYPSPTQDSLDIAEVQAWAEKLATAKSARITGLVNKMYSSYQGDQKNLEAAQLQSKLDGLIVLRDRLV
jgi:hypothetical protein